MTFGLPGIGEYHVQLTHYNNNNNTTSVYNAIAWVVGIKGKIL